VDTAEGLRDAARRARECTVTGQAVSLARWIGSGRRPVTPGGVLRKADVQTAGAVLGVDVPSKLRTMADIRELQRPWCVAVATGLLQVSDGSVTAGAALEGWPPDDGDLLAQWLTGLRAVCAAESHPDDEDSVRLLALALLTELGADGGRAGGRRAAGRRKQSFFETAEALADRYGKHYSDLDTVARRYGDVWGSDEPPAGLAALLDGFGAVIDDPGGPVITPLGRWAAEHLAEGLPARAALDWPAGEVIAEAARFGDEEQQAFVARTWIFKRGPVRAAREILAAAEDMPALQRCVAVELVDRLLGDDALPAWREMVSARNVGPHARAWLASGEQGPEPGDADWRWLAIEAAAASLEDQGPDEAFSRVWENMPGADLDERLAAVRATGHPEAEPLAQAAAAFAASGAPRSIDQVAQLKVSLRRARPPIWRRVLLPATATLGDLHQVIQVLFGWDGDHLHLFDTGNKRYSDPFTRLEETGNEEAIRVRDAIAAGGTIAYTYDFGADWEHVITLEKTVPRDHSQQYPVCVAFKGDSLVEYWDEEEPEEPVPFVIKEVNRRLAALDREPA
jgi:hypothetical protein